MPNFDKTGPNGQGSNTGQGRGSCLNQEAQPERIGRGFGRGRNRCVNRGYRQNFIQSNQSISLDDQEKILEARLEKVRAAKKASNSENDA